MEERYTDEQISKLTGMPKEQLDEIIHGTEYGKQTVQFLAQWSELITMSLKANGAVLRKCLANDDDGKHIACRFCGEGIPNWKAESSREHSSECPINGVREALSAAKKLNSEMRCT